ncbi:MAG: carboxypeptidase regulatory-like domain-containing protein [Xanthomonadales bacterium]|nr:carboxypeptidase regulatory-like domain-containing protein [Xanthomonadales bacterium]
MKRKPWPTLTLVASIAACLSGNASAGDAPVPQTAPYKDRIISSENLAPLPADNDDDANGSGRPRAFHMQLDASRNALGDKVYDESGMSAGGFWESDNYGSFSIDASMFHTDSDRFGQRHWGGTATLWQRDLPVAGGWRVDSGLGVLNTPMLPLQRNQYRFVLPSVPLAGASTSWRNDANGLVVQASAGRSGLLTGTRMVGFDATRGDVESLGAQWSPAPGWTAGGMFLGSQDTILSPDGIGPAVATGNTRAFLAAAAWANKMSSVQMNVLTSRDGRDDAVGAWIDGATVNGRYTHNYGVFHLDPGLSWGQWPISNDAEGGYYRLAYRFARWNWSVGVDQIKSISGHGFDGTYANAYVRYQANSTLGYGGSLALRHSGSSDDFNLEGFIDKRTRWGQTRLQIDHARTDISRARYWQAAIDQSFPIERGARLNASLSTEWQDDGLGHSGHSHALSLYGGYDLSERLSLDGNMRWTRGDGPDARRGLDANLGLNWRLGNRWVVTGAYYRSLGSQRSPFVLDPLATQAPFVSLPRNRSVYLSIRYAFEAGQSQGVLGGAPNDASGSIAGSIFLDDNADGIRAASEQPAANVTVILDDRYSVRTDASGNFNFPRVAVGKHRLTISPDNLPLPWTILDGAADRQLNVTVRSATRIDIGATRPR